MIWRQPGAIVWAQWRSIWNYSRYGGGRVPWTFVFALVWYGIWGIGAYGVAGVSADPENIDLLDRALPIALLLVFLYWQLVPIMMASTGLALDLSRLLVYPIPHVQLFGIEVVLRITTSIEMIIITTGLAIGLLRNPRVPVWGLLGVLAFTALNLLVSAGLRDLFTRLMARKGFRESLVFFIVLLAAVPQLLMLGTGPSQWRALMERGFGPVWPWSSAARVALGHAEFLSLVLLVVWTAAAYFFSRYQFERNLSFDAAESSSASGSLSSRKTLVDLLVRMPTAFLRDPLAVLVEKEIRSLSRAPRFRLLFVMGFSFGLLIWLPLALRGNEHSSLRGNYLTIVTAYALMLLGEVCFWNTFGMDRAAAQTYFVMPVKISTVLVAKNISAALFIVLEILLVAFFCYVLRMPLTPADVGEAFAVTTVLAMFMVATGNLLSTRYPRAVDPSHSWRSGSMGRVQAFLLVIYPIASAPILLAYAARYAFETNLAFYGVLAADLVVGIIVYYIALESAAGTAETERERILQALSSVQGPIGT